MLVNQRDDATEGFLVRTVIYVQKNSFNCKIQKKSGLLKSNAA